MTPKRRWPLAVGVILLALALFTGCAQAPTPPGPTATAPPTAAQQPPANATPTASPVLPPPTPTPGPPIWLYTSQAGDTLVALAARFGVAEDEIMWEQGTPANYNPLTLIDPGTHLQIPNVTEFDNPTAHLLPDSEVIFSNAAADFDALAYTETQGGFFSSYTSNNLVSMPLTGAKLLARTALENSINPRLLLAVLEYRCGCVLGPLPEDVHPDYLADVAGWQNEGLYKQLVWLIAQLNAGYYGWRAGTLTELTFADGSIYPLDPSLNAGTAALYYLLAQFHPEPAAWQAAIDPENGFPALYASMFGDPWKRAITPLLPAGLRQPPLILPFLPGHTWSYTGGPHSAWEKAGPRAAIDFTPSSLEISCEVSYEWVTAMADGLVVRTEPGILIQDLDGDGNEHTGWVLVYVHLSQATDLPPIHAGDWLTTDQLIGHPSCEGGPSSSAHLHIARKYNGEWMLAGQGLPLTLDGWVVGELPDFYTGTLSKDGLTINSCTCSTSDTYIKRPRE